MTKSFRDHRRTGVTWTLAFPVVGLMVTLLGCPPPLPPVPAPISLAQALQKHNANVAALPAFKASVAEWKIQIVDPDSGETYRHSDLMGRTYYRPEANQDTDSFYLRLSTFIEKEALVIGANPDASWLYSKLLKQGWWKSNGVDPAAPGQTMLDVDLLLFSLGYRPLSYNSAYNYKIMPEHNIIEYRLGDGDGLLREIILDRRSNRPVEINHYNAHGRRVLHTALGEYRPCADAEIPASVYIEFSPDGDDFLRLRLSSVKPDREARIRRRDLLYTRPKRIPGLDSYEEITAP